jgi:hypothetical protein
MAEDSIDHFFDSWTEEERQTIADKISLLVVGLMEYEEQERLEKTGKITEKTIKEG